MSTVASVLWVKELSKRHLLLQSGHSSRCRFEDVVMNTAQINALNILIKRPHLLWSNVDKSLNCWEWTASLNRSGYGSIRVGTTAILAHRAAYLLEGKTLNLGDCVCHHCDNPKCCNPLHLFVSNHSGNMADMRTKGRRKGIGTGVANGRAKLTNETVQTIRTQRLNGLRLKELAQTYGVATIPST